MQIQGFEIQFKMYIKISPKLFIKFYFAASTRTIDIKIKYIPNVMHIGG